MPLKLPDLPVVYVYWAVSAVVLALGARFRLPAMLSAGAAAPGAQRTTKALVVLALDVSSFLSACFLLRMGPFPILMSALVVFALSAGLLWAQWTFRKPADAGVTQAGGSAPGRAQSAANSAAAAARTFKDGIQGIQGAALSAGYGRAEAWVKERVQANHWVASLVYQGILLAICLGLRVLDMLQGGWLYVLFSLIWQGGATGALYWQFDRKRQASPVPSPEMPAAGISGKPSAPRSPSTSPAQTAASRSRPLFARLPYVVPGINTGVGKPGIPGGAAPAASTASASPNVPRPARRRKFAFRSDVQAMVALSAGIWCGIFSRFFGWAYGFGSVVLFRTLLSVGSPLTVQLLGKYVPPALQPYLKVQPKAPLFSLKYLRSRDFWYGPGMGMVGGAVGAIVRHIVLGR